MEKIVRKVVVMGGSFNPPTVAHYRLMKAAIDALGAEIGIFVPVSDAYLKRKMRHSHPPVVLSPELRVKMLQTMCTDDRMAVNEIEIGTIEPRTVPTLNALQRKYPDAELYSVMGADKLDLIVTLTKKRGLLDKFNVMLFSREGVALDHALRSNDVLSPYLDRIVTLPQPEGVDIISSSLVRERMMSGESAHDLLCPGVWELFKGFTPADFPDVINKFADEHAFLSNRYRSPFVWQGIEYRTAEAAFQASKSKDETERKKYARCSANKAKSMGKDQIPYPGWEEAQLEIMESILSAKFEQSAELMQKLEDTGNSILINGAGYHDTYWGTDLYSWQGENHLGKIIMRIRDKKI